MTAKGNFQGRSVLSLPPEASYFAEQRRMSFPELESRIQIFKSRLWEEREKRIRSFSPACAYHAMNVLRFYDRTSPTIVIVLNQNSDYQREIFDLIYGRFSPHLSLVWKQEKEEKLSLIAPLTKAHTCQKGQTTVYICRQGICEKPLTDIEEIRRIFFSL